jgi:hypothetical protein
MQKLVSGPVPRQPKGTYDDGMLPNSRREIEGAL